MPAALKEAVSRELCYLSWRITNKEFMSPLNPTDAGQDSAFTCCSPLSIPFNRSDGHFCFPLLSAAMLSGRRCHFPFSLRAALPLIHPRCFPMTFFLPPPANLYASSQTAVVSLHRSSEGLSAPRKTSVIRVSTSGTGSNINFTSQEVHRPRHHYKKVWFMD